MGLCISGKFSRAASDASGGTACICSSTDGEDHEPQWGRARSNFYCVSSTGHNVSAVGF